MKSDFCKPDGNHLWQEVSNLIWTDVSETLRSDLTVRDASLRHYATPDPRLFQLLLLGDITGGGLIPVVVAR